MLLTDDFVYIHQPKTGGTFVTQLLTKLHESKTSGTFVNRLLNKRKNGFVNINKHGTCSDIPVSHRNKPILASVRNPYDRYVSQYKFGWWKRYPESFGDVNEMRKIYPHFPELTFEEFVNLSNALFLQFKNVRLSSAQRLGWQTEQFVKFFFRNPKEVFSVIDEDYIVHRKYQEDMFDVHFIRCHRLNQELYDFLLGVGYDRKKLEFIIASGKIFHQKGEEVKRKRGRNSVLQN